jgi:hypothetical protein
VSAVGGESLPELANVYWRPLASARRLDRIGLLWTGWTAAHTVPFIGTAATLIALNPVTTPVALLSLAHAWIIPELYASRGANVVRRRRSNVGADGADGVVSEPERRALGLLGDLLDHDARELHARTGLVLEPGTLGIWLVAEAGALLVRPGGRRVHCYCIRVSEPDLPAGDRVAHLLLALRSDERGFTTVANLAFAGARWRVRRRLPGPMREALDVAGRQARQSKREA